MIIMAKVLKLGQYKNIEVHVERHVVTEEEVNSQIEAMVAQSTTLVDKEGTVENGDVTIIDFKGMKDGVAFDGGTAQGFQLEIGSGQFVPGFEDQMIGMAKGETRNLDITFPTNYTPELAGQAVVFEVTVHEIKTKKEAELNDEFAASLGNPEVTTVEGLKEQMKAYLEATASQEFSRNVENAVFDILLAESEVEVEDADVESALNQHISHLSMEMQQQGFALEQYLSMMGMNEEALREQLKPSAVSQAKFEAIIDAVVKAEGLATTDEELDQYVTMMAAQYQREKEELLKEINLEDLKRDFNRFKSSQVVISSAIVK